LGDAAASAPYLFIYIPGDEDEVTRARACLEKKLQRCHPEGGLNERENSISGDESERVCGMTDHKKSSLYNIKKCAPSLGNGIIFSAAACFIIKFLSARQQSDDFAAKDKLE